MTRLQGQRILITGVSRGVGFETARLFLAEGAEVLGVARDATRLQRAATELGNERLTTLASDVALPETAERIASAVRERWGALDVLFNNAGVQLDAGASGFQDVAPDALARSIEINLMGPYRLCRALLPLLLASKAPRIVNVSSGAGNFQSMRQSGIPTYRLSKWALNGFTMLLAAELAGKVQVNAFDPGWVKTDLGGPNAPGTPDESARGALALITTPPNESGTFWKDGNEIPW